MMASTGVLFVLLACLFSLAAPFSYESHCNCVPTYRIRRRPSSLLLAKSGDVSTGDEGNRSKSREKWILIIEDDDNLRKAMGKFIAKEGYCVTGVADARSGLLICRGIVRPNDKRSRFAFDPDFNATQPDGLPDCLVLDSRLGPMDGIELLKTMRADPTLESMPVVLLTSSKVEERLAGYDAGADAYIAKPFDPNELMAVIDGLLLRNDRYRVSGDGTGRSDQSGMQQNAYANLKRELSDIKELLEGLDDGPSPSKLDDSSGEISASSISQDIAEIREAIESLNTNGQPQSKSDDTAKRSYKYAESILSPEDTEIMELVAQGLSNNDIAAEMDCSVSKIEKRMTAMFKEAGVRKRASLIEWWQMNQ